jgi:hypothetical protein
MIGATTGFDGRCHAVDSDLRYLAAEEVNSDEERVRWRSC